MTIIKELCFVHFMSQCMSIQSSSQLPLTPAGSKISDASERNGILLRKTKNKKQKPYWVTLHNTKVTKLCVKLNNSFPHAFFIEEMSVPCLF